MVGLHESITLSFLIVGHTKFSPDWCFGLFKRRFRHTRVGCLDDIVRVVETSAEVNVTQLVASQDGTTIVPIYDWATHFHSHFRQTALKGIKSYQHFRFQRSAPGKVFVKESCSDIEKEITLVKEWQPTSTELPTILKPAGLTEDSRTSLKRLGNFALQRCRTPYAQSLLPFNPCSPLLPNP